MNNQRLSQLIKKFVRKFSDSEHARSCHYFLLNLSKLQEIIERVDAVDYRDTIPSYRHHIKGIIESTRNAFERENPTLNCSKILYSLDILKSVILEEVTYSDSANFIESIVDPSESPECWITGFEHVQGSRYLVKTSDGKTGEIDFCREAKKNHLFKELIEFHRIDHYQLEAGKVRWESGVILTPAQAKSLMLA